MIRHVQLGRLVTILAVALLVVASACSGGDDGEEPSPTSEPSGSQSDATATPDSGGSGETPTTSANTPTAAPTTGGGGMTDDLAGQMQEILKDADKVEYVVTYETNAEFEGGKYVGTTTMYEGGERSRTDFALEFGGQQIVGASITTPEKSYFCGDQDGEKVCFEFPADQESIFPDPSEQFSDTVDQFGDNSDQYSISAAPGRTIAGQSAICFEVEGPEGTGTVCFSKDGVLLFMDMDSPDGKFSMEATEYRLGVTDEDFEPPYPVTSFGT